MSESANFRPSDEQERQKLLHDLTSRIQAMLAKDRPKIPPLQPGARFPLLDFAPNVSLVLQRMPAPSPGHKLVLVLRQPFLLDVEGAVETPASLPEETAPEPPDESLAKPKKSRKSNKK